MEEVIVVLGTVAAMLAWCATIGWHVARRAEGRSRFIETTGRKAMNALGELLIRKL